MILNYKKFISLTLVLIIGLSLVFPIFQARAQARQQPAAQQGQAPPAQAGAVPNQIDATIHKDDKGESFVSTIIGNIASATYGVAIAAISLVFGAVLSPVIYLENKLIDFLLNPDDIPTTNAEVVRIGWIITRDIANLFFILILLIMAVSTILRSQPYAFQQLFSRLIIAALLINFSLVFAGVVIDFTQFFTKVFYSQITSGGYGDLTLRFMNAMKLTNFQKPSNNNISAIAGATNATLLTPAGAILNLVALVVAAFVFGAAAVFLIVRIGYLWFLLIFAPLAWLLWILPATSSYFSKWWQDLLKWSFFAPIYAFMIFLSLSIFDTAGNLRLGDTARLPADWQTSATGFQGGSLAAIFQFILVIFLLFGSLLVARNFGVEGAKGSVDMINGWREKSVNWAGRKLRKTAVEATKPVEAEVPGAPPPSRFRKAGAFIGGLALKTPGVRGAYVDMIKAETKEYGDAYNKYKDVDPAVLQQMTGSPLLDDRTRLAIQQALIEKNKFVPNAQGLTQILDRAKRYGQEEKFLDLAAQKVASEGEMTAARGFTEEIIGNVIKRAKNYGKDKDFAKHFPITAARALGKTVEEVVRKIEKASDIYEDQLTTNVVETLSPKQLKDIGSQASEAKRQQVRRVIEGDFLALSATETDIINDVLTETDKKIRQKKKDALPESLKRLLVNTEIVNTPRWELNI